MFPNFFVVCIELCLVVLSVPFEVTKDALHSVDLGTCFSAITAKL